MEGHAKKCVERYCELANKTTHQLYEVSSPCIDDHHFKEEELKSVGELSQVCSQIVLKCLYLARIGRLYILCSVLKLARSITKWTKACDKRLSRLISSMIIQVNTGKIVMWETQQNNPDWDCFKTPILQEIMKIRNPLLEEHCAFLEVFEDNEAVIKMIIKGRSPTMRHVSRTHRVALDWLFDRINLDPKIQIKYIDTKNQLADSLT